MLCAGPPRAADWPGWAASPCARGRALLVAPVQVSGEVPPRLADNCSRTVLRGCAGYGSGLLWKSNNASYRQDEIRCYTSSSKVPI
jgi:hypothetical protein